jgi:hypothetical protein
MLFKFIDNYNINILNNGIYLLHMIYESDDFTQVGLFINNSLELLYEPPHKLLTIYETIKLHTNDIISFKTIPNMNLILLTDFDNKINTINLWKI